MGVKDLLLQLSSITRKTNVSAFSGKRVAIDVSCWLHRGSASCARELVRGETVTTKHVTFVLNMIDMLIRAGIKAEDIVLVFDGQRTLESKRETNAKRDERRAKAKALALMHEGSGNMTLANKFYQQAVAVTDEMVRQVQDALRSKKISFITAPYEADAQLAHLSMQDLCDVVISEDSDTLVYGCRVVMFKLSSEGNGEVIERKDLGANSEPCFSSFTNEQFMTFACLSGCDYVKLDRVGPKIAYRYVSQHKTAKRVVAALEGANYVLPPNFLDTLQRAIWTFQHQTIFSLITNQQEPLSPLPLLLARRDVSFLGKIFPLLDDQKDTVQRKEEEQSMWAFDSHAPPPPPASSSSSSSSSLNARGSKAVPQHQQQQQQQQQPKKKREKKQQQQHHQQHQEQHEQVQDRSSVGFFAPCLPLCIQTACLTYNSRLPGFQTLHRRKRRREEKGGAEGTDEVTIKGTFGGGANKRVSIDHFHQDPSSTTNFHAASSAAPSSAEHHLPDPSFPFFSSFSPAAQPFDLALSQTTAPFSSHHQQQQQCSFFDSNTHTPTHAVRHAFWDEDDFCTHVHPQDAGDYSLQRQKEEEGGEEEEKLHHHHQRQQQQQQQESFTSPQLLAPPLAFAYARYTPQDLPLPLSGYSTFSPYTPTHSHTRMHARSNDKPSTFGIFPCSSSFSDLFNEHDLVPFSIPSSSERGVFPPIHNFRNDSQQNYFTQPVLLSDRRLW